MAPCAAECLHFLRFTMNLFVGLLVLAGELMLQDNTKLRRLLGSAASAIFSEVILRLLA